MRHRVPLPARLGESFLMRDAARAGVRRGRADAADLHRPFHGVRSLAAPACFTEQVAAYRPRMSPDQYLVGVSAARAWGLPLARSWSPAEPIEIGVPTQLSPPRTAGVRGRRLHRDRVRIHRSRGVRIADPVATCFSLAPTLTRDEAVTILDALVTSSFNYPGLGPGRPLSSLDEIRERLAQWGRFPGSGVIRAALPSVREGVESPKETETRLALVSARLPEPVVQHDVFDGGRFVARADLAYPQLRIAIEYEGDGHRTDKDQWRTDIRRQRELEDLGWIVIRLTADDLTHGRDAFLSRVRRAISARS
ncbi:endonuclease domain-containing protein [Microbacterium sp. NPDC058345]|uniref:endonuclease domain-containing protein n=1 Tax=Microbacterium sp. NPDC058345 TaxID=3346455 RepID=UPI0036639152